VGFARAVNAGLAARPSTLVLLLNDDAELLPGWLVTVRGALDADARAVAAQGVDLARAGGAVTGCGIGWNRWWQAVQLGIGGAPPSGAPREVFGVSAAAALVRREALARAATPDGPLDARLDTYYEDVELAARLRAGGGRALLVPAAQAVHPGGGSASALGARARRLLYGNRLLVLARLLGRALPPALPAALLRDLADVARHPAWAPGVLLGWGRALRLLPQFGRPGAPLVRRDELRRLSVERFA
jgi:GT2 family glycosyltransferase